MNKYFVTREKNERMSGHGCCVVDNQWRMPPASVLKKSARKHKSAR